MNYVGRSIVICIGLCAAIGVEGTLGDGIRPSAEILKPRSNKKITLLRNLEEEVDLFKVNVAALLLLELKSKREQRQAVEQNAPSILVSMKR